MGFPTLKRGIWLGRGRLTERDGRLGEGIRVLVSIREGQGPLSGKTTIDSGMTICRGSGIDRLVTLEGGGMVALAGNKI